MFEPHFGIDESGKGDFFGPLVIAGVYVDPRSRENFSMLEFRTANESDRMHGFGPSRKSFEPRPEPSIDIVAIGPERYNDLYEKFGNLNSLLGWGHARVIENLLAKKPECPRASVGQVC